MLTMLRCCCYWVLFCFWVFFLDWFLDTKFSTTLFFALRLMQKNFKSLKIIFYKCYKPKKQNKKQQKQELGFSDKSQIKCFSARKCPPYFLNTTPFATQCSAPHEVALWCLVVNQHDMFTVDSVHLIKKACCVSLGSKKMHAMFFFQYFITFTRQRCLV